MSSLHQILVITKLTFHEARRRKLLWLGLGMGIVFVALFSTGFYLIYQDEIANRPNEPAFMADWFSNMFLMAGLYVVNFLVIMVTVLTSVGTLSAEIDSNTIHAIAAKPIRRWEIVLGKWIGHALLLAMYTLVMSVGLVTAVYLISGYMPPNVIGGLAILLLESAVTLSITMLGSSRLSTLANGVLVFMLYGVSFVGGWVEQIGSLLDSRTAIDIGIASSLLMPSEALYRYAAGLHQPANPMQGGITPFTVTSQPTPAFLIYGLVYLLVTLGATMVIFTRRDV
jgi:ABC-type transport system involved in multi-copper enzyme maturation permease subunit